MYEIEMNKMLGVFFPCWKVAGIHFSKQVGGGIQSWLCAHPFPLFFELKRPGVILFVTSLR